MSIFDGLRSFLTIQEPPPLAPPLQERSLEQMQVAAFPGRYRGSQWHTASTREAMGVPAVFRAVSLISNTVGTLSLEAYRKSRQLSSEETPRVVIRPNPRTTPQVFHRDTAYYLCRYGEVWLYAPERDSDGNARAIFPVDPKEVTVEEARDPFRPKITWRGRAMDNDNFRAVTFQPDPDNPHRGVGPLQMCGAALSVSIESQMWAANFYSEGGIPSVLIHAAMQLDDEGREADDLRDQWMSKGGGTPRVVDPRIEKVEFPGATPEDAQVAQSQSHSVGEAARMYGIPGPLLEYNSAGSSLHYQNDVSIWRQFQSACLSPGYLEPVEQAISDFLTGTLTLNYNVNRLLRSDPKTRAEIYDILIRNKVIDSYEARMAEGFEPGDIENRPIPAALPSAIPTVPQLRSLDGAITTTERRETRCPNCNRLAFTATGDHRAIGLEHKCRGCGTMVA